MKYRFEDFEKGSIIWFSTKDKLIDYLVYQKIGQCEWRKEN